MSVGVLLPSMLVYPVCAWCPQRLEQSITALEIELKDRLELKHGCWYCGSRGRSVSART